MAEALTLPNPLAAQMQQTASLSNNLNRLTAGVEYNLEDLKNMITALMTQVDTLASIVEMNSTTQSSLDNLRTACQLMAAKVDATATPATSFVSTFNDNI